MWFVFVCYCSGRIPLDDRITCIHINPKTKKIMQIWVESPSPRVSDDANITNGHIRGQGVSIDNDCASHVTYLMLVV